jgi:hypothetical protein
MKTFTYALGCVAVCFSTVFSAEAPAPQVSSKVAGAVGTFTPPYPGRSNPFQLPNNTAAMVTRRDATVHQIDLRLKGFINVGEGLRAVVVLNGEVTSLANGERRGELQVLDIAPPTLTLQQGRHRWTESLLNPQATKAIAQNQ